MLKGKKIVLGVTGSIAAYKAAILVRLLVKAGAEVQVVMTPAAKEFITPLTLATLSGRPVLCDFTNLVAPFTNLLLISLLLATLLHNLPALVVTVVTPGTFEIACPAF